ncbi:prepilin peptidase [Candidatus Collierbacteria bacterium]|nr:prepilin peptidase [Candidatus Collierbacteria bacterium]
MSLTFTWLSYIMGFIIGTAIGSFLGVVIVRQTTNDKRQTTKIGGRSRCDSCKKQLMWWENIPLVSFVFLKGKCRNCRSPIPYWLPLIELAGGLAGVWLASWASQTITVITFITVINFIGAGLMASALIWVFFSDLAYGLIPDLAVGVGVIGAVLSHLSNLSDLGYLSASAGAAGFILLLVIITRGRGMGTGDVTLAGLLGLWLGWPDILLAVWLAFIFGAVAGLTLIGLKLKRFGQTIPFGPFLIAGSVIAAMANDNWKTILGL